MKTRQSSPLGDKLSPCISTPLQNHIVAYSPTLHYQSCTFTIFFVVVVNLGCAHVMDILSNVQIHSFNCLGMGEIHEKDQN